MVAMPTNEPKIGILQSATEKTIVAVVVLKRTNAPAHQVRREKSHPAFKPIAVNPHDFTKL